MTLPPFDSTERIRTARARDFYLAYLNSSSWKTRRNQALRLAEWRCQRCYSKRDLQVHHTTYERLGAEWDQDLEVVCITCHEAHHIEEAFKSDLGIYLKLANEALRGQPFASMAELSEETKVLCAKYHVTYDGAHIHRALELVTGRRFVRLDRPRRQDEPPREPDYFSAQDAHELLMRLDIPVFLKSMPAADKSPAEQVAHEARLREQMAEELGKTYREERQRVPLRARLEQIFAKVGL